MTSNGSWSEFFVRVERKSIGSLRANEREIFEAILFMLHTGIQWHYMPLGFPPKSTVYEYPQLWCQRDAFRKLFATLIGRMLKLGRMEIDKSIIDNTFAAAKCGGEAVGLTRKDKGTKIQLDTDAHGTILAVSSILPMWHRLERMAGDKTYDYDARDIMLGDLGIEMISPHRRNRKPENRT